MTESSGPSEEPDPLHLELSTDQALVLFDWLRRGAAEESKGFEDQAELRVLWDLECLLEAALVAPLTTDYRLRLEQARANLRDC